MTPGLSFPLGVPVLTDGHVTLRAHTPADTGPTHEMCQDPDMQRWTAIPVPYSWTDATAFIREIVPDGWNSGRMRSWAIEVDGRFAGNVDLRGSGPICDIGYALHPDHRGRGVMRAAVNLVVQHAFTEAGKEVVRWAAHVGNEASLRVAHACGFALHGVQPGLLYERGRVIDAWTASIRFGDAPVPRTSWRASTLSAPRLRLRPPAGRDAPRIIEACNDALTRRFLAELPDPYGEKQAASYLADSVWRAATGDAETWAITDPDDDVLRGAVAVMDLTYDDVDYGAGEIGYWMHPEARGRGLAGEALRTAVRHAFDPGGLNRRRLTLYAAASNAASQAVAEGAGFRRFGVQRSAEPLGDGGFDDLIGYELLRE